MDTIKIAEDINRHRRLFLGAATLTVAAAQFGLIGPAAAQRVEAKMRAIKPGTNTSFGPLKQINAGVLNVGYAEAGPANGEFTAAELGRPRSNGSLCRCSRKLRLIAQELSDRTQTLDVVANGLYSGSQRNGQQQAGRIPQKAPQHQ